jgi:hypothetical protein
VTGGPPVVRSLHERTVIFTGTLHLDGRGVTRTEASELARRAGAVVSANSRAKVSRFTNVLVRGESGTWRHGDYGDDEKRVALYQAQGHDVAIIDASGFASLLAGGWAYTIRPNADTLKLPARTAPYRPAQDEAPPSPVATTVDLITATNAHNRFQNELAEYVLAAGLTPLRSTRPDAQFDLGWEDGDSLVIVEVKSLAAGSSVQQLRLGLGQVLDYKARLGKVSAILAVDSDPPEPAHWESLCADHGVTLVWPAVIERVLRA